MRVNRWVLGCGIAAAIAVAVVVVAFFTLAAMILPPPKKPLTPADMRQQAHEQMDEAQLAKLSPDDRRRRWTDRITSALAGPCLSSRDSKELVHEFQSEGLPNISTVDAWWSGSSWVMSGAASAGVPEAYAQAHFAHTFFRTAVTCDMTLRPGNSVEVVEALTARFGPPDQSNQGPGAGEWVWMWRTDAAGRREARVPSSSDERTAADKLTAGETLTVIVALGIPATQSYPATVAIQSKVYRAKASPSLF